MLVVDTHGDVGGLPLSGYWYRETRYLRTLRLRVNGKKPELTALGAPSHDLLAIVYIYPELDHFGGGGSGAASDETTFDADGVAHRSIDLRVTHRLHLLGCTSTITLANRGTRVVQLDVEVELGADFADLIDAVGSSQPPPRAAVESNVEGDHLLFRHEHPALPYLTEVRAHGGRFFGKTARWSSVLEPRAVRSLVLEIVPRDFRNRIDLEGARARMAALEAWRVDQASVEVRGAGAAPRVIERAIEDLRSFPLLEGEPDEWLALQAGVPLYPALFGRDALTAGWQASFLDRGASLDAGLVRLGNLQSRRTRDFTDEEPGRIPQQVRTGPGARLGENPFAAYYGDVASPLMFVISMAQHYAWTGNEECARRHLPVARRILEWASIHGDKDGDGYLEYETRSPLGPKNQAWKDSGDAMVDEHGRQVKPPIAACEIQGYWFAAQDLLAIMLRLLGEKSEARAWREKAQALKRRFNRDFWMEDEGYYGLCLGPDKKLVRSVTSNVGHCIATGIIDRERLPRVVSRMFAPDMWSGWGIRTLSAEHPAYNPLSYHNGSVWAVEQATIAYGLRRFGFDREAIALADATLELASLYPAARIPETVGGYDRHEFPHPGAYPRANAPQLWNVSALPSFLHSMMGLIPLAPLKLLVLDPRFPACIDELFLENLRVGDASVDLRFWRGPSGRTHFEVLDKRGTLRIVRQPPPESMSVGLAGRIGAFASGLMAA